MKSCRAWLARTSAHDLVERVEESEGGDQGCEGDDAVALRRVTVGTAVLRVLWAWVGDDHLEDSSGDEQVQESRRGLRIVLGVGRQLDASLRVVGAGDEMLA